MKTAPKLLLLCQTVLILPLETETLWSFRGSRNVCWCTGRRRRWFIADDNNHGECIDAIKVHAITDPDCVSEVDAASWSLR